jgi:hypothetical protein
VIESLCPQPEHWICICPSVTQEKVVRTFVGLPLRVFQMNCSSLPHLPQENGKRRPQGGEPDIRQGQGELTPKLDCEIFFLW